MIEMSWSRISAAHTYYWTMYVRCTSMWIERMTFVGMCCIWFQSTCTWHPWHNQKQTRAESKAKKGGAKEYNEIKCSGMFELFDTRKHVREQTRQTMWIGNVLHSVWNWMWNIYCRAQPMRIEKSNIARADNRVWLINLFRPTSSSSSSLRVFMSLHLTALTCDCW